jgi:hypothetical protein
VRSFSGRGVDRRPTVTLLSKKMSSDMKIFLAGKRLKEDMELQIIILETEDSLNSF